MADERSPAARPTTGWVRTRLPNGRRVMARVVNHPTHGRVVLVRPITRKD